MGNDFTRMKSAFPTWETILQRKRMEQKNKIFNLGTFFCLYIAQTIPMSFLYRHPGNDAAGEFFFISHRFAATDQAALDTEIPLVADGGSPCPDNGRL